MIFFFECVKGCTPLFCCVIERKTTRRSVCSLLACRIASSCWGLNRSSFLGGLWGFLAREECLSAWQILVHAIWAAGVFLQLVDSLCRVRCSVSAQSCTRS